MKKLAIIPARGGSKRIKKKNIKDFLDKPIISYSIEAAQKSNIFDEIMVSTDDNEISEISKKYGAKVPFFRSLKNSDDYATIPEVCLEVISEYEKQGLFFEEVCCILPTAPFIDYNKIILAEKILSDGNYECIFTITDFSYPIQRSLKIENNFVKMNWPENYTKRSQDLQKMYHDAGQFYFFKTISLFEQKKIFMNKSNGIILSNLEVQDIDNEVDWKLAELKYKFLNNII